MLQVVLIVYMQTGGNKNLHPVRHIEEYCNNMHKGKVRVGFSKKLELYTSPRFQHDLLKYD